MSHLSAVLASILASASARPVAPVQTPAGQEDREKRPSPAPSTQRNTLRLKLLYYYDEENQDPHLRHPETPFGVPQFGQRNQSNLLEFDADYIFLGQPKATVQLAPVVTPTLTATSLAIDVGRSFGDIQRIVTGNPFNPPSPTKTGFFGSSDSDDTDSDTTVLFGPEIDLPVKDDLSELGITSWLPGWTSLHLYARALFGSFEVFDVESDLQLLSFGPRVNVPLLRADWLEMSFSLSAGPAFLMTDIGDAVGFEAAAGLRLDLPITSGLSFTTGLGYGVFSAENVASRGPLLTLGLTLSW